MSDCRHEAYLDWDSPLCTQSSKQHTFSRKCFGADVSKWISGTVHESRYKSMSTSKSAKGESKKTLKLPCKSLRAAYSDTQPLNLIQKETPRPSPHASRSTRQSPLGTAILKWLTSSTLSTPKRVFVAPSRATSTVEEAFWLSDSISWPLSSSSRLHLPNISTGKKNKTKQKTATFERHSFNTIVLRRSRKRPARLSVFIFP